MQVIDVDSHVTVIRGLEDTPFQVKLLPDVGHLTEFDGHRLDQTRRTARLRGRTSRPSIFAIPGIWTVDWRISIRTASIGRS